MTQHTTQWPCTYTCNTGYDLEGGFAQSGTWSGLCNGEGHHMQKVFLMIIWMILGMGQSHTLLLCMTQLPATLVMLATVSMKMSGEWSGTAPSCSG